VRRGSARLVCQIASELRIRLRAWCNRSAGSKVGQPRDLLTRKIAGWAMREHMRAELVIAAAMAIQRQKPPPGLIHHSGRGSQHAAGDGRKVLNAAERIQSMSR